MITPNKRQLTPSMAVAEDRSNDEPVRRADKRVGVAAVWRETLFTFGDNAPAIVLCAVIGFAGPALACILASVVLRLDFYGQASGPLATWLGLTLRDGAINPVKAVLWLQAGLGAVGLALARGAIARLALSEATHAPSLGIACREAKSHLPSLLLGSLIYGAVVTTGAVGVNANANVRYDAFDLSDVAASDLSFVGQRSNSIRGHVQVLGLRAIDAFVPSPGSPFAEFVPLLRHTAFEPFPQVMSTELQELEGHGTDKVSVKIRPDLQWLIVLTSVCLLILAEALLRFTPIMAMKSREGGRPRAIMPVLHGVGFGIRHFGVISAHVWLLRLAFVAGYSIFFMLPVILAHDAAPRVVTNVRELVLGHWSLPLTLACYWLAMALFMAFSTVYDARLFLALEQKAKSR